MERRGRVETLQWVLDSLANHLPINGPLAAINRVTPAINHINPLAAPQSPDSDRLLTFLQQGIIPPSSSTILKHYCSLDITAPGHSSRRFVHGKTKINRRELDPLPPSQPNRRALPSGETRAANY
jgi:hypothetical protein